MKAILAEGPVGASIPTTGRLEPLDRAPVHHERRGARTIPEAGLMRDSFTDDFRVPTEQEADAGARSTLTATHKGVMGRGAEASAESSHTRDCKSTGLRCVRR